MRGPARRATDGLRRRSLPDRVSPKARHSGGRPMASFHVIAGASERPAHLTIRKIGTADLMDALRRGWDDFAEIPTHAIFVCLIYPIIGLVLGRLAIGYAVLPLLFPLATGF